jgi:hypothetical protein
MVSSVEISLYVQMISFANSSIPVGINLPNYEEIRQVRTTSSNVVDSASCSLQDVTSLCVVFYMRDNH